MSRFLAARSLSTFFRLAVSAGFLVVVAPSSVLAAITKSGDVTPDPATWTGSTDAYVGNTSKGTLTVDAGSSVSSALSYVGYAYGSAGTAIVDGTGSMWAVNKTLHVGYMGDGILNIVNGGVVSCSFTSGIARVPGTTGVVTVDGAGSAWNINNSWSDLSVGGSGNNGALNITNGGIVTVGGTTYVAYGTSNAGGTGTISFGASGGTLTTLSLAASASQLAGSGTINTRGLLTDGSLVFDSLASLKQTITLQSQPNQDVTIHLDMSDSSSTNGNLGAGWRGNGSLVIKNGITVNCHAGDIAYQDGSTGVATVDGVGSCWNSQGIDVGVAGRGALNITSGASVIASAGAYIGVNQGSAGVVNVHGAGSIWTIGKNNLSVGQFGSGLLSITNGGVVNASGSIAGVTDTFIGHYGGSGVVTVDGVGSKFNSNTSLYVGSGAKLLITGGSAVTATGVSLYSTSFVAVDVGRGSLLSVAGGTAAITNAGTIRILAGAGVPTDTIKYSPILAQTWSGTGTCQPIGGTWDAVNHTFTASAVQPGTSGSPLEHVNLSAIQRVLIGDFGSDKTNWAVGASFPAAASPTDVTFTATAISDAVLDALEIAAGERQAVLSGWMFSTTGYTVSTTNPLYLSFDVGADYPQDDFAIWHYDGGSWTKFAPIDLTYDGRYASFSATGLSGYAVTSIPEPGTLALLAAALLGLFACARRKQP